MQVSGLAPFRLLNAPFLLWIVVESAAGSGVALAVGCGQFLYTVIRAIDLHGALGIVLALASFFTGLAGHQACRWWRLAHAPFARGIAVSDVPKHPGALRFSFSRGAVAREKLASKTISSRGRNGTTSSSTYYAAPIVEGDGPEVAAWSVGLGPDAVRGKGGAVAGTVADDFHDGYLRAVQACEAKFGLRSAAGAVLLELGEPDAQLEFMGKTVWVVLLVVNGFWLAISLIAASATSASRP